LKVNIFRPGEITGAKPTGIWKMNDLVSRFIVASIQMECMPGADINVHMTPVDFIADAIVNLSLQKQSVGKGFNLVNKNTKTVKELADIISSFGYKIKVIPYEEWKQRLVKDSENALKLLEPLFLEEKSEEESITRRYADLEASFDITNVVNGLKGTNISCAPVDKELIFKYLNHFIDAGYIPDPKTKEIPEQNSKELYSTV
jgi:thioester reductase-like protein